MPRSFRLQARDSASPSSVDSTVQVSCGATKAIERVSGSRELASSSMRCCIGRAVSCKSPQPECSSCPSSFSCSSPGSCAGCGLESQGHSCSRPILPRSMTPSSTCPSLPTHRARPLGGVMPINATRARSSQVTRRVCRGDIIRWQGAERQTIGVGHGRSKGEPSAYLSRTQGPAVTGNYSPGSYPQDPRPLGQGGCLRSGISAFSRGQGSESHPHAGFTALDRGCLPCLQGLSCGPRGLGSGPPWPDCPVRRPRLYSWPGVGHLPPATPAAAQGCGRAAV